MNLVEGTYLQGTITLVPADGVSHDLDLNSGCWVHSITFHPCANVLLVIGFMKIHALEHTYIFFYLVHG